MDSLQDKVVLITGAGKGAGRRAAELFAARGACIAAVDITPINLDETASRLLASGRCIKTYVVDISKKMSVQGLISQVQADFGRLDIVINCAEVEPVKSVLEMDEWDWFRVLEVNLSGAFLLTQAAGRLMRDNKRGLIIHLGSRPKGRERRAAYLASKAGLEAMVKICAEEFSADGMLVHLVNSPEAALEVCLV